MNFKNAKVDMLPTEQNPTPISIGNKSKIGEYHQFLFGKKEGIYNNHTFQHLYINSDDKIKEGDWCINTGGNIKDSFPFRATKEVMNNKFIKKIIATTDTSLYIHQEETFYLPERVFYLPYPSQQFIQKFVEEYNKGNIITDVLVEYEDIIYNPEKDREYQSNDRINIEDCDKQTRLKINPKDNTITIKIVKDCYSREEVVQLLINCCAEISSIHGKLKGKEPADLYEWIEENL